ncbi:MAG: hypothetical protein ABL966_07020 [Acidimicrobiales bacterium]
MAAQPREGAGPDRPWASVFDPSANARALADIQAQGLRAAGELVERLIRAVDGDRQRTPPAAEPDAVAGAEAPAGEATRLAEVWIDLLRRTADSFGRLTSPGAPGSPGGQVAVDVSSGASDGELRVEVVDDTAAGEVWLHNGTTAAVGPLRLHCGVPRSGEGVDLDAVVAFEPGRIDELPPRSSRAVAATVRVSGPAAPGTYRAMVQAAGITDLWLPLVVVVSEAAT